jgi:hypothetical protein
MPSVTVEKPRMSTNMTLSSRSAPSGVRAASGLASIRPINAGGRK